MCILQKIRPEGQFETGGIFAHCKFSALLRRAVNGRANKAERLAANWTAMAAYLQVAERKPAILRAPTRGLRRRAASVRRGASPVTDYEREGKRETILEGAVSSRATMKTGFCSTKGQKGGQGTSCRRILPSWQKGESRNGIRGGRRGRGGRGGR
jgi:hypothetical protein